MINRAHSCFKNEETLEKCDNTGNPEGTLNFKVGIAFPTALLKKENKLMVCMIFFICLFVLLPVGIYLYTTEMDCYDENGVQVGSLGNMYHLLESKNILPKSVIEMLSVSRELEPIIFTKQDQRSDVIEIIDESFKSSLGKDRFFPIKKIFYLIYAYMKGRNIPKSLLEDLYFIQRKSRILLQTFSEHICAASTAQNRFFLPLQCY